MSLVETEIQRNGGKTDYSRGRDRCGRNGGRGAVTNCTRVLVKGGTLEDLGGVEMWREGLEGKVQGAEKPDVFEGPSVTSHTLDSPTTSSFVHYTLTAPNCLHMPNQTCLLPAILNALCGPCRLYGHISFEQQS